MKILNIQLSLFAEVPTTIRGGERCSMAHGKPTRAKYKVVFQNGNYRCVCGRCVKAFRPGGKKSKMVSNICNMDDDKTRCCGNCALCVHTYLGSECGLTDNPVDDNHFLR